MLKYQNVTKLLIIPNFQMLLQYCGFHHHFFLTFFLFVTLTLIYIIADKILFTKKNRKKKENNDRIFLDKKKNLTGLVY